MHLTFLSSFVPSALSQPNWTDAEHESVIELFVRHLAVHEDTVVVNKAPKLESEHETRFYLWQILSKKVQFRLYASIRRFWDDVGGAWVTFVEETSMSWVSELAFWRFLMNFGKYHTKPDPIMRTITLNNSHNRSIHKIVFEGCVAQGDWHGFWKVKKNWK